MIELLPVLSLLTDAFSKYDWRVSRQDASGPDIIVTAPDGKVFVLELKTGTGPAHFASLAQVASYADSLQTETTEAVTPVLLTTQAVNSGLEDIAGEVGVEILQVPDTAGADDTWAESIVQRLKAQAEA